MQRPRSNLPSTKTPIKKRRASQKWKVQEREVSRHMQTADGPTTHPALKLLQTVTGRLGHLHSLRMDSVSKNYVIEVKNRKLPLWIVEAWELSHKNAVDYGLHELLVLTLTTDQICGDCNGSPVKLSPLYCITQERHDELLMKERELELRTNLSGV